MKRLHIMIIFLLACVVLLCVHRCSAQKRIKGEVDLVFVSSNSVEVAGRQFKLESSEDGASIRNILAPSANVYLHGLEKTSARQFWYLLDPGEQSNELSSCEYVYWGVCTPDGKRHKIKMYGYEFDMNPNRDNYKGIIIHLTDMPRATVINFNAAEIRHSYLEVRYHYMEEAGDRIVDVITEYLKYGNDGNDIYLVPIL